MSQAIYSLHFSILDAIQEHLRTLWLDAVIPYLTMLGDAGAIWILLAIVLMLIPGKRKVGLTVAAALLIDLIICNGILKPLIARIRPYDLHTGISLLIKASTDYSFPSGHTAASFAAASALLYRKDRLWIPAMVLAALIAFTRLYLYVHYPTDVLTSVILGIGFAILSFFLIKKLYEKIDNKLNK